MPFDPTNAPPSTLDATLSRIDVQTQAAVDAVERARAFTARLDRLRGQGNVSGVRVGVDHLGLTRTIDYTAAATRLGPEALAAATLAALGAALDDVLRQVTEHTHRTWGADPVAEQIVAETAARFAGVSR